MKTNKDVKPRYVAEDEKGRKAESVSEYTIRVLNAHDQLLSAAKNARNVLAALVLGNLKEVKADSPALLALRDAIAKAEGKGE